jgi:BirA family biotin operon repressor/biotin-[acetyl-CoA-carboxylase] ligase
MTNLQPREEWHLPTLHIGRRVLVYDRVASTNALATTLADDLANAGIVLVAQEQTAGRGQHGRTWSCPVGEGVLLSVLLFPPPTVRRPVVLAAWAANSVCETIHQTAGLPAQIKWPNDVLVHGRKVCGILIEQGRGTVAGIGLNVNQCWETLAAADLPQAASLALSAGRRFEVADVARLLIGQLDEEYARLCQGDLQALEASWRSRTGLLGKSVEVECPEAVYRGRLHELGWEGLVLGLSSGETLNLQPEAVRHITHIP